MKLVTGITIVACVLALGGASSASHKVYGWATRCANVDFYDSHERWCNAAHRVGAVKHLARAQVSFPAVQPYDEVTNIHDHQGVNDASSTNTPILRLQTAQNVANGSPWYAAVAAAFNPGSWTLGVQHVAREAVPAMAAAPRPAVRTTVSTMTRPLSLTTNRPVEITIRPLGRVVAER